MSPEVRVFQKNDLLEIEPSPHQEGFLQDWMGQDSGFTLLNGEILCCWGWIVPWAGRGLAWSVLSRHSGPYMGRIRKAILASFEDCPARLEMLVDPEFPAAFRFGDLLGFTLEGRLRKFRSGKDYLLMARIVE